MVTLLLKGTSAYGLHCLLFKLHQLATLSYKKLYVIHVFFFQILLIFLHLFSDCSGKFDKDSGTLVLPVTQFPTTCHAQFVAKANQTVYVSSGNRTAQSVPVYDGGSVNAPQIGDFSIGNVSYARCIKLLPVLNS